jgi:hypothetical protein
MLKGRNTMKKIETKKERDVEWYMNEFIIDNEVAS